MLLHPRIGCSRSRLPLAIYAAAKRLFRCDMHLKSVAYESDAFTHEPANCLLL